MAGEGKPRPHPHRMQDLGYKALTTFVKQAVYHAMDRCTQDERLSHSRYIAGLIEADLAKKGYLKLGTPPPPSPVAGRAPGRQKPKGPAGK